MENCMVYNPPKDFITDANNIMEICKLKLQQMLWDP